MNWEIGEIPKGWTRGERLVMSIGPGRMRAVSRSGLYIPVSGADSTCSEVCFTFDSHDAPLAKRVALWIQWFEMGDSARSFDFAVDTLPDGWQRSDELMFEVPAKNPTELRISRLCAPADYILVSMEDQVEYRRAHVWLASLRSSQ